MLMTKSRSNGPSKDQPGLDAESQAQIGRMLKAMYDEVAREEVPDKFLELLKQLEAKENTQQ